VEKEGVVSIWLGKSDSIKDFQQYLQANYSEEGNYINSKFEQDFDIDCFDEDLREMNYLEDPSNSFSLIVSNHSYCESIISNYLKKLDDELDMEYDCIILLYDFDYMGNIKEVSHKGISIKFIGPCDYSKND